MISNYGEPHYFPPSLYTAKEALSDEIQIIEAIEEKYPEVKTMKGAAIARLREREKAGCSAREIWESGNKERTRIGEYIQSFEQGKAEAKQKAQATQKTFQKIDDKVRAKEFGEFTFHFPEKPALKKCLLNNPWLNNTPFNEKGITKAVSEFASEKLANTEINAKGMPHEVYFLMDQLCLGRDLDTGNPLPKLELSLQTLPQLQVATEVALIECAKKPEADVPKKPAGMRAIEAFAMANLGF